MSSNDNVTRIRELNDRLRTTRQGGKVLMTAGIDALGPLAVAVILGEVAVFNSFTGDNDPYHEHDCVSMTIEGVKVMWKIDYYDKSFTYGSPDPSDPEATSRIMTVMLAEEY